MEITSAAFVDGESIPSKHTCEGADSSPALSFRDVPADAVSLALIMDDPDVPNHIREDGVWDHWIVFNISPGTREVAEGQEPDGTPGTGTSGNNEYHGPCPPDGEHRYLFKLYALDTELELPHGSSKAEVEQALTGHIIARAELLGLYDRAS
jgi:hypothetical protein